jgi:hypothetical protein
VTRIALAAAAGLLAWAFVFLLDGLRIAISPWVWERVTAESVGWALAYAPVFAAAGVACAFCTRLPRIAKYPAVGAVIGAVLWSYLTATWAFSARTAAVVPPGTGVLEAVLIGAVLGALGGLLLLGVVLLRWRD